MVAVNADLFHAGPEAAARLCDGRHSRGRNHAQAAQAPTHDADRVVVDQADLAQAKFAVGEFEPARFARVRKSSPMHSEAGRTIDLTQQPQIDLAESLHAPADALIVVDCICRAETRGRGQFIGDQTSGTPAVEQFAQTKIEAQSVLCLLEASFVFAQHGAASSPRRCLQGPRDPAGRWGETLSGWPSSRNDEAAEQGAKRPRRNATRAPVQTCCSATHVKKSTV